jgi:hypothetical protein
MKYQDIKIVESLLEYDRSKTAQNVGAKLVNAATADNLFWNKIQNQQPEQQIDAILQSLESMDPTANKRYVQWLARQYINQQFKLEDAPRVKQILGYFTERDVIRDFKRRGLGIDINQYDYRKLRTEVVTSAEGGIDQSSSQIKIDLDYKNIKDMNVLYSGELGQLIVPKTESASCELGLGTNWCTAWTTDDNQFDNYNKEGPLYVWIEPDGKKYQFHFESTQFMDTEDDPISSSLLKYFREKIPSQADCSKLVNKSCWTKKMQNQPMHTPSM